MAYIKDINRQRFVQTATVTTANTVAATTIIGAGDGSTTLSGGSTQIGKTFKLKGAGVFTNTGTPTLNLIIGLGGVTALTTGAITTVTGATNRLFTFEGTITIRTVGASGTAFAQGTFTETLATGVSLVYPMATTAVFAVDTTAELVFTATTTWSAASASNTISTTNFVIEEID